MFTAAIVAIVLAYTWLVGPVTPRWTAMIAGTLVLAVAVRRSLATGEWGLRRSAFVPALAASTLFTIAGAVAMYLAGIRLGSWHDRHLAAEEFAILIAWGLGQQFVLQTVILSEAQARLTASAKATAVKRADATFAACVVAALVFGALHLPNPFLAAVTFLGALAWCWIYSRYPNVVPLALSHAVLTAVILFAFDDRITGRLRVGAAYLAMR